jgi:hypothetical protein
MRLPSIVTSVLYVGFVAWSLYGAVVPIETYLFRMVHMGFIFALTIAGRTIHFKQEVGFGGAVRMHARPPRLRPGASLGEVGAYLRDLFQPAG